MSIDKYPDGKPVNKDEGNPFPAFKLLRNIDLNLLTVFEAVYLHKGIVNAAKVLNLTPSAISQSIQKLRLLFPDPLFIRKGQGVIPTAYATWLHDYISKGFDSILSALDFQYTNSAQRTITIATRPTYGALLLPQIFAAVREVNPNITIRHIAVEDGEAQLAQLQTDILIDANRYYSSAVASFPLFKERLILACSPDHPFYMLPKPHCSEQQQLAILQDYLQREVAQRVSELFPDGIISFSSYNMLTVAAMVGSGQLAGLLPERIFAMLRSTYPLYESPWARSADKPLETNLHINKLALRDALLNEVIDAIRNALSE